MNCIINYSGDIDVSLKLQKMPFLHPLVLVCIFKKADNAHVLSAVIGQDAVFKQPRPQKNCSNKTLSFFVKGKMDTFPRIAFSGLAATFFLSRRVL